MHAIAAVLRLLACTVAVSVERTSAPVPSRTATNRFWVGANSTIITVATIP